MANKFEEFCDRNFEKHEERKEKRKAKREKFQQEHPKLSDALLKAQVTIGVLAIFAVPYFAGRSSKCEQVEAEAKFKGYLDAANDFSKEYGRESCDYIGDDGKYYQDLHFGAYAIWKNRDAYLDAERQRLDSLPEGNPNNSHQKES